MTPTASSVLPTRTRTGAPDMNVLNEALAREYDAARLAEAERLRRQRLLVTAARLSRKAERAAYDARLALARLGA